MAVGHHVLFHRQEWSLRPESKQLRETTELKLNPINTTDHTELHKLCPPIPLLGYFALTRTLANFYPVKGNTLASVDNLMLAIEESNQHPKAHTIEKNLGDLAIWALDLQRPFIADVIQKRTVL